MSVAVEIQPVVPRLVDSLNADTVVVCDTEAAEQLSVDGVANARPPLGVLDRRQLVGHGRVHRRRVSHVDGPQAEALEVFNQGDLLLVRYVVMDSEQRFRADL